MFEKIGIIIKDNKAPEVSLMEMNYILRALETKSVGTIVCENVLEAKKKIQEKYEEISFIYFISPIPTLEKSTYDFLEVITKNENYKHIRFFARLRKREKDSEYKDSKYKWYDDFINYIKL